MLQPLDSVPIDPFFGYHTYSPSQEEILQSLFNGLNGQHIPKSQPVHNVNLDVMLSSEQLRRGAAISLEIPISQICARCSGSGQAGFFECDACAGHGLFWHSRRLDVMIPGNSRDGTSRPISLRDVGVTNMYLTLRLRFNGIDQQSQ